MLCFFSDRSRQYNCKNVNSLIIGSVSKIVPRHALKATGRVEKQLLASLTLALGGCERSAPRSDRFISRKNVCFAQRLGSCLGPRTFKLGYKYPPIFSYFCLKDVILLSLYLFLLERAIETFQVNLISENTSV
jgi:hypothetical protein